MMIPEPTDDDKMYDIPHHYRFYGEDDPDDYTHLDVGELCGLLRRAYHAERERDALRAKLHDSDRIGTHYDGCWDSGPRHYACAVAEITKLRARVAELEAKGVAGE